MTLERSERRKHSSTRSYVYSVLRDNIISLNLEPGLNLSEKEVSEMLEVSRTPVREAFVKLVQDELLEVFPQRGSFVALIDQKHVDEARFIREHLEKAAIKLACVSFPPDSVQKLEVNLHMQKHYIDKKNFTKFFELDEEFHETIAEGSGRRIWAVIQQMNIHLNRVRMLSLTEEYNWEVILKQHEEMIVTIREQNSQQAKALMKNHLTLINDDVTKLKQTYPNYFK